MNQPFARQATVLRNLLRWTSAIPLGALLICHAAVAFDNRVDDIMYQDPTLPDLIARTEFPRGLKPLWLEALARPESELQRMAADTISLAHRSGMPGLDIAADKLLAILGQEPIEPTVRRAAAQALASLDAEPAAKLFAASMASGSLEMARIVEPALAHWDYEPARAIWRQRLVDPEIERSRLLLAIECLGIVKDSDATSALLAIVANVNTEVPVRLSAARAAAAINDSGVIAAADELASAKKDQATASLLAATLLSGQSDARAVSVLKRVAAIDSVTASGVALRRLFEIDPTHVYELCASAIQSVDVNIRRVGCAALAHQADAASIGQLAPMLNDTNPSLRRTVSESLVGLAEQAALREVVIQSTTDVVAGDAWRGLEQGLIVLTSLDHEPAAPRFIELLSHRRPEVAVTAAWGLRKLAVADTLSAMLAHAEQQTQRIVERTFEPRYLRTIDLQTSQLFQAFGELNYNAAEPLMRKFIPKKLLTFDAARPAAVWAVCKLNEGKDVEEDLAKLLGERLADIMGMMPEREPVRRMSAVGIGRLKAESQLPVLRQFVVEAPGSPGRECAWAIERITGEVHEYSLLHVISPGDWFLTPNYATSPNEAD